VYAGDAGVYAGDMGVYAGELGEYAGDVGVYAGDVGEYAGDTGEYAGDVGEAACCEEFVVDWSDRLVGTPVNTSLQKGQRTLRSLSRQIIRAHGRHIFAWQQPR
jgi:hypothetical protein